MTPELAQSLSEQIGAFLLYTVVCESLVVLLLAIIATRALARG